MSLNVLFLLLLLKLSVYQVMQLKLQLFDSFLASLELIQQICAAGILYCLSFASYLLGSNGFDGLLSQIGDLLYEHSFDLVFLVVESDFLVLVQCLHCEEVRVHNFIKVKHLGKILFKQILKNLLHLFILKQG